MKDNRKETEADIMTQVILERDLKDLEELKAEGIILCGRCTYWKNKTTAGDIASCHRFPPQNISYGPDNLLECKWPVTRYYDWCGEAREVCQWLKG
jgi:hypothetical protein